MIVSQIKSTDRPDGLHPVVASMEALTIDGVSPIGKRIEWALSRKGWSQNRLEKEAGLSDGHVNKLLSAVRPSHATIAKIAPLLGVTNEWIQTGRGNPELPLPEDGAGETEEDPYPNRAEALGILDTTIDLRVRRTLRKRKLKPPHEDMPVEWWLTQAHNLQVQAWQSDIELVKKRNNIGIDTAFPLGEKGRQLLPPSQEEIREAARRNLSIVPPLDDEPTPKKPR